MSNEGTPLKLNGIHRLPPAAPEPWELTDLNRLLLAMQRQGWRGMVKIFSEGNGAWAEFIKDPLCTQRSGISPILAAQEAAKVALEGKL